MGADFTVRILRIEAMTEERIVALSELIRRCRQDGIDGEIAYRPPSGTTPPPWWENTLISIAPTVLETATDADLQRLVDTLCVRAREWAESRVRDARTRPQSITIFGPDGVPVRKLEVSQESIRDNEHCSDAASTS